jgi:transporter family protein
VAATPTARAAVAEGVGGRAWLFVALSGLAGACSWWAYFGALRLGPAGPVAALDRLSLAFVVLGAAALLGESLGWRGWAGLGLVLCGTALIVMDGGAPA